MTWGSPQSAAIRSCLGVGEQEPEHCIPPAWPDWAIQRGQESGWPDGDASVASVCRPMQKHAKHPASRVTLSSSKIKAEEGFPGGWRDPYLGRHQEGRTCGDFKNGGRELRQKDSPMPVRVHDFVILKSARGTVGLRASPNDGWVNMRDQQRHRRVCGCEQRPMGARLGALAIHAKRL